MTAVAPDIEALARAMAISLGEDPDLSISTSFEWEPFPKKRTYEVGMSTCDMLCYVPLWMRYAWLAQQFIFTNSGGKRGTIQYTQDPR